MWIDKNKSKFNKKLCLGFIFIVILFTVCSCAQIKQSDGVLLNRESEWKYLGDTAYIAENYKNDQDWTAPGIDDSMWKQGKGSFGAKNGEKGSLGSSGVIDVLLNQYTEEGINQPTYFFRTSFLLEKPEEFQAFKAKVEYDDAIIIYINGEKVFEGNTPDAGYADNVSYGANKRIEAPNQEEFYITDTSMLNKGENVVAVEVHQVNEKSSDVFFSMEELKLLTEKPQQEEVIKPEAAADPENLELSELWVSPAADPMDYRIQALSNQEENLKIYYKEQQTDAGPMEKELSVAYKEGIEKYRYEAELSGLSANTRYEYYISNGKDRTKTYEIEIPDENGLYTFWFIGDPQFRENEIEEDFRVFSEVLQRGKEQWGKPQLLLAAGDIADDGEAVKGYEQFAEIDEFKYTPMLALKGNHDGDFFEY